MDEAFTAFMDLTMDALIAKGLQPEVALDVIFTSADYLTEEGALPRFPDDRASVEAKGMWLVQAADLDFPAFVAEAVNA